MKDKLLEIVNHYGINEQLKYIHSEYFELDEAIMDFNYDPNCNECLDDEERQQIVGEKTYHIAEEIADIMVMLKQFQYLYNICDECIEDIMKKKIERQLDRIGE